MKTGFISDIKRPFFCICAMLLLLGSSPAVSAGNGEFSILTVPKDLVKGANAVKRIEEVRVEIFSPTEIIVKERLAITILNERGNDWAAWTKMYDKHTEIISVEGFLYDAMGNQIKKVKKKDFQDLSGTDDEAFVSDNRYKQHNFYYRAYPYTVEYISEIKRKASLFFPAWAPLDREGLSAERSSISIACHNDYQFRYKAFNYDKDPTITQEKKVKVYTWTASNLPAIWREVYSPRWHELTTYVIFGPTEFQMDDYKGNMKTWQDFGKFIQALRADRDILPDNIKQEVHRLTDGISDTKEKIKVLYEYMQRNTRYVGIQLGIGGWQPFDARYVATKGYGDCKALSNYMFSLLKEAGIRSNYTVIRSDEYNNPITEDFPSQQFNHVILCVPLQKDSLWLECTSQTAPAGYLGKNTIDRLALLIDEDGGKLVRTTRSSLSNNIQERKVTATLQDDATLELKATTRYGGIQQDEIHGMIHALSRDKVKEYLHRMYDFPTYEVNDFRYSEKKSANPVIDETLDITVSNYANITGKRLFITPNIMTRSGRKLSMDSVRRSDILLGQPYLNIDSAEIRIPEGYTQEAVPGSVDVDSKFGKYKSEIRLEGNKIYYTRRIEYNGGRYPAKDYEELVKFFESVYKADRNRVVLVKNSN